VNRFRPHAHIALLLTLLTLTDTAAQTPQRPVARRPAAPTAKPSAAP